MSFNRADTLTYGQLGSVSYDPSTKRWILQRQPCRCWSLESTGRSRLLVKPSTRPLEHVRATYEGRKRGLRSLLRKEAAFAPVQELLPTLARVSELVEDSGLHHSTLTSDLLAYGTILNTANNSHIQAPEMPFLSMVTGRLGNRVSVTAFRNDPCLFRSRSEVRLSASRLVPACSAKWRHSLGYAIQQLVCLDGPYRRQGYLAVRTTLGTSVLRSVIRDARAVHGSAPSCPYSLDIDPVSEISNKLSGRSTQLDATFNPWKPEQLAILDTRGIFTIFDTGASDIQESTPIASSTACQILDDEDSDSAPNQQGWGRLLWVGNRTTILCCSPTTITLYNIQPEVHVLESIEINPSNTEDRVLDIHRDSVHSNVVYALTTRKVLCIQVSDDLHSKWAEATAPSLSIALSWKHHRNANDLSLRLQACAIPGDAGSCPHAAITGPTDPALLMIYSTVSPLIIAYPVYFPDSSSLAIFVVDPVSVSLHDSHKATSERTPHNLTFCFRLVAVDLDSSATESRTGLAYLLQILRLDANHGLHEEVAMVSFRAPGVAGMQNSPTSNVSDNRLPQQLQDSSLSSGLMDFSPSKSENPSAHTSTSKPARSTAPRPRTGNRSGISEETLQRITTQSTASIDDDPAETTPIYNDLLQLWLSPLPTSYPSRARIRLDRALQDIAIQIDLSSQTEIQGSTAETAISRQPSLLQPSRAQLATPPASSAPTSTADRRGRPQTPRGAAEPASERTPERAATSTSMSALGISTASILDEWELGADPYAYEWGDARSIFEPSGAAASSQRSSRRSSQRASSQRKADARARLDAPLTPSSQMDSLQATSSQVAASEVAASQVSSSQMTPSQTEQPASQVAGSQPARPVASSQVPQSSASQLAKLVIRTPGSQKTKKKKKRRTGFE